MRMFKKLGTRFVFGVLALSLLGQGCAAGPDPAAVAAAKKTDLNIWSVVDDGDVYEQIIADYRALHPFVTVNYRRFRIEEYEDQLLNAFAEDRGPDIFLIHNTWVGKYMSKLLPMPPSTKIAELVTQGTLKKEVVPVLQTMPSVSIRQFKTDYPDVVVQDFLRTVNVSTKSDTRDMQSRVIAMPVSVDTLAMYANKDLLNAAGIATLPTTWDAFQEAVKKLTKLDANGEILQSGAALGTSANVERAPDILSVLMMQNGAQMVGPDNNPTFQSIPEKLSGLRDQPPSYQALAFYTDFANPAKDVYSWNAKQPNSLDAFVQGKTAFFFGYSYHLPTIRARAPKLNLAIAQLPQIEGNPVANFANYWGWTVSKKTKVSDIAWNFLNFLHTPDEAKKYLTAAKRPAALKSLLPSQAEDEDVGVFASQVLTAQSWYRGNDPRAADAALNALIDAAPTTDPDRIGSIMNAAADKISQTIPYGG